MKLVTAFLSLLLIKHMYQLVLHYMQSCVYIAIASSRKHSNMCALGSYIANDTILMHV